MVRGEEEKRRGERERERERERSAGVERGSLSAVSL